MLGTFSKVSKTPQGGLKVPAYLTRTGVFTYHQPDGTTVRELRHPDEVFNQDSLDTLAGAPITVGHPLTKVESDNWQQLAVGHVGDKVKQDGKFVSSDVRIQQKDAVKAIEDGNLVEMSCGYDCVVDTSPGVYEGAEYDAVQRDIRYNHVGLGPKNWGRAGNDVGLKLDSSVNYAISYTYGMALEDKKPGEPTAKTDAVPAPVAPPAPAAPAAPSVPVVLANHPDTARADSLQGQLDAALKENTALKAALAPEQVEARVNARLALIGKARTIVSKETVLDGKSEREIMVEVIRSTEPDFKADGHSDEYLKGQFDHIVKNTSAATAKLGEVRADAARAVETGAVSKVASAYEQMCQRNRDAWKSAPEGK